MKDTQVTVCAHREATFSYGRYNDIIMAMSRIYSPLIMCCTWPSIRCLLFHLRPVTALEKAEEGSCLPRAGSDGIAQPLGPNHHLSLSLHERPVWSVLSPSLPWTQFQPQLCRFPSGQSLCSSRASDGQVGGTRGPATLGLGACVPQRPHQRPCWGWEGVSRQF